MASRSTFNECGDAKLPVVDLDSKESHGDVLCGRGKKCYHHVGTERFHKRVLTHHHDGSERFRIKRVLTHLVDKRSVVRQNSPKGGFDTTLPNQIAGADQTASDEKGMIFDPTHTKVAQRGGLMQGCIPSDPLFQITLMTDSESDAKLPAVDDNTNGPNQDLPGPHSPPISPFDCSNFSETDFSLDELDAFTQLMADSESVELALRKAKQPRAVEDPTATLALSVGDFHAVVGHHYNTTAKFALILVRIIFQKFMVRAMKQAEPFFEDYWSLFCLIYWALHDYPTNEQPELLSPRTRKWGKHIKKGAREYAIEVTEKGQKKQLALFHGDRKGLFLGFCASPARKNNDTDFIRRSVVLKESGDPDCAQLEGGSQGDRHVWFGGGTPNTKQSGLFDLILYCHKEYNGIERIIIHGLPQSFVPPEIQKSARLPAGQASRHPMKQAARIPNIDLPVHENILPAGSQGARPMQGFGTESYQDPTLFYQREKFSRFMKSSASCEPSLAPKIQQMNAFLLEQEQSQRAPVLDPAMADLKSRLDAEKWRALWKHFESAIAQSSLSISTGKSEGEDR